MTQDLARPNTGLEVVQAQREPGLSVATLQHTKAQLELLESYVKTVLRPDEDYGSVPGVQRQFLWKAGAENLFAAFNCHAEFEVVERVIDTATGYILYSHRCRAVHHGTGQIMEVGDGSCNSYEVKYRYRNSERVCPRCQAATIRKSRRDEGGWYCWNKIGGCGAQFPDGDASVENQNTERQENPDKMDLANTIMKMSMKRSSVDCAMRFPGVARFFAVPRDAAEQATSEEGEASQPTGAPAAARPASRSQARRTAAQAAPASHPGATAAPARGKAEAAVCTLHGNTKLLKHEGHPDWGLVHKLPTGYFCNGKGPIEESNASGAPPPADGPDDLPPSQAQDLAALQQDVGEAGLEWEQFQLVVLKMGWPEYLKRGGTVLAALEKLGAWQNAQPTGG